VFAHVFLQEVTEETENLCWISFLLLKNNVSNISVHSVNSSEAGGFLILQSRCMNGDEMDGFAIEIAWLIVRMAKRSSVATRRHHDAVNDPWVSTHGSACQ
jgi:hypothetical protein